jgi:hypothetical protein
MQRLIILFLTCLLGAGLALDEHTTLIEAKVYIDDIRSFNRLCDLAEDLYICSRGIDEFGSYLLIITNDEQLSRVKDYGLETKITWIDLDDKFIALTGVNPHNLDRPQDFGYYFTYWEMRDSVSVIAAAYPEICSLFVIGTTHQGREILCLKISDNAAVEENEPACFFNGSTHGNEPMGTSIVMAFIDEILSGYGSDPISTWLIDNREIYLVPILNPDCSVFCSDSAGANIYWRKNRRIVQSPYIGVDPSRNHGFRWGWDNIGSSPNPQNHAYRGPFPWSDAEAFAARNLEAVHQFRTQQDFHCFGGFNAYPWTYTYASPPEQALLQEIVDSFQLYNGYADSLTGQASHVLYLANGTQIDWEFSDTADKFVTYAFTIEADTWFWACWNDSILYRIECERNVPTLYFLARVAGVYFVPISVIVNDTLLGNSSGQLDPGESANLWFTIRNQAVHPIDSAYSINARLISEDTNVVIIDSLKSFSRVSRRASTNNSTEQFEVRASNLSHSGDTIPLRLELSFIDAGNAIIQQLRFEIVLGDNYVGVDENRIPSSTPVIRTATIIRAVLFLPEFSEKPSAKDSREQKISAVLFDIRGSKVLDLHPGASSVSFLSPGIYFLRFGAKSMIKKLIVTK